MTNPGQAVWCFKTSCQQGGYFVAMLFLPSEKPSHELETKPSETGPEATQRLLVAPGGCGPGGCTHQPPGTPERLQNECATGVCKAGCTHAVSPTTRSTAVISSVVKLSGEHEAQSSRGPRRPGRVRLGGGASALQSQRHTTHNAHTGEPWCFKNVLYTK